MRTGTGKIARHGSIILVVLWCICHAVVAQVNEAFPTRNVSDFDTKRPGHCWDNNMKLDQISQAIPKDKHLIIIARLGEKERNTKLNKRRLENVRTYLTSGVTEQFRRMPDSIIIAEGGRTKGLGQIEFYLDGRLIELLIPYSNVDLSVTECYAGTDGDPWCKTPRQKLFYPCRDDAKMKTPKTRIKKK